MMKMDLTPILSGSLVSGLLAILLGCGGNPGTSALMGEFAPSLHVIEAPNVNMAHNPDQTGGTLIAVDITVLTPNDKPVYDAIFDLKFNPDIIKFVKFERGSFLESTSKNGVDYFITVLEGTTNTLVAHISQTADDPGKAGNGVLGTLVFEILSPGCGFLSFVTSNSVLRTPDAAPIINVKWSGGTITVRLEGDVKVCPPPPVL
jgi:hypothetical protein